MNKKKIKQIFTALTILIILALIGISGYNVRLFAMAKQDNEVKQAELEVVEEEIRLIRAKIARYEEEKAEFEAALFQEQDIPASLDDISQMAKEANVNITNMKTKSFREVKSATGIDTAKTQYQDRKKTQKQLERDQQRQMEKIITLAALPINMKVEGEFRALLGFFDTLEDFQQLVTVSNVEIVAGREYPLLKCEYTLKIYSLKKLSEIDTR
ncbi:MAG: type 4a pilus biogenesis protein PilO [Candidatus Omnitrophica bacterium]|nr:type 4a pilus biogenesis protein PilO [Candidatus Omnitrophota bacterium]